MFGLFKQNTGHSQEKGDFFFFLPFISVSCVSEHNNKKKKSVFVTL